jgi:DNA-binding LacI/PurR family transcriptional regulator
VTDATTSDEAPHPKSRGAARRALRRGPTIDDVAALAGVSRGTVSRVLNGGHDVSAAALAAVQNAILSSGYVVNQSARSLVTRTTNAVAFVLSEPQERLFEDPNFSVLLRCATQALAERNISLVLMIAGGPEDRDRELGYLRAGHVDGVLLVSSHGGDPLITALARDRVPFVVCGKPLGYGDDMPYVCADDRAGGQQMTQYLSDLGRRRIAMITGPLDTSGGYERLQGYFDVLGRRAPRRRVVSASEYSYAAGEAAMEQLLEQSPDLDALFVASDLVAAGALSVLRRSGRKVPEDVAVGGFDDSHVAVTTEPPLTTVRQPLERVAEAMVALLLDQIAGEPVRSVTLPTTIVRRESA